MEKTAKKCKHASCACMTTDDSHYCSTYCAGQAEAVDVVCECGHTGCGDAKDVKVGEKAGDQVIFL
jgi:hypothetical protein